MLRTSELTTALVLACAAAGLQPTAARALDKQGASHGGDPGGAPGGFAVSSSLLGGVALFNPTYAARPDNTGHTLLRLAPHVDVDLIGSRLSIPIDINFFSDRDRKGLGKVAPSELDLISGLTSTWPLGPTALELGVRAEADLPVDRGGFRQAYSDARAKWLFSLGRFLPSLQDALAGGDVTGSATLGWFVYNPSYAARPDNSGRALLRYAFHLSVHYTERFFVAVDTTFFTDRRQNALAPSELDFTPELGVSVTDNVDVHLAYERDMPIDRGGTVQHFLLLFATWDHSWIETAPAEPEPASERRSRKRTHIAPP